MTKKLRHVLIVEDDPISQYCTKSMIEDMGVAQHVDVKNNGLEALNFLASRCFDPHPPTSLCPDLILLDINMPDMNGFEMLEKLQEINQQIRHFSNVVLLTTSSHPKDREAAERFGTGHYLLKPLTESMVMDIMDKLLPVSR